MKKIVVVGSLNMDCVVETPAMPKAGDSGKKRGPGAWRKRRESGICYR